jgi:hypothetical protein
VEEVGIDNASSLRKALKKQYGGASEDVKHREEIFENGMPEKGKKVFPKGIDIEAKLRQLFREWQELVLLCPEENKETYKYAKESELVKICLKHLRHTEYDQTIKELLNDIKFDRKLARAMAGGNVEDAEDDNLEDWEYRNYKDDWVPSFEKLRDKLVGHYKEVKYNKSLKDDDQDKQALPAMVTKALVQKAVSALLAPGFGQRPLGSNKSSIEGGRQPKAKCWACGQLGHRSGDVLCKAEPGTVHSSAPEKAKRKFQGEKGSAKEGEPKNKKPTNVCRFFLNNGTCRFGANCKFKHEASSSENPTKKVRFSKKKSALSVKALKAKVIKELKTKGVDELDQMVRGFLMVRTIPRECSKDSILTLSAMNAALVDMKCFAYDTGAGEGISTSEDDFVYLDKSPEAIQSVTIQGPSVGTPTCVGRGPLVYVFDHGDLKLGLIHPSGVLASSSESAPQFRLASAMQLKKRGVRYIGGKFDGQDYIECVRSDLQFPAEECDGILTKTTNGIAKDILESPEFKDLIEQIENGLSSPLVDIRPYLKGIYKTSEDGNGRYAEMAQDHPINIFLNKVVKGEKISVLLMNESKLTTDERSRLYCRRFGFCDTNIFTVMSKMQEYQGLPELKPLNEDNFVADLSKFKRRAFSRNDPVNTMNAPPFFKVMVDGYGGQQSLGGPSLEGAVGGYLFVCVATGSTDIRFYASHTQFPVALHQFLVRVQAEFWHCRVIYADTHSVNLSSAVEEVLALFQVQLVPISAGTPQELAFAESRVRLIKRMSTAMLANAPHLGPNCWALADRYTVYVMDFMPQQTRGNHCSFYLRTGRAVDWSLVHLKVFGAPLLFSPPDGPIHKRAPITEKGWFAGMQYPAVLVVRDRDKKIINVAKQKVRVHESCYTLPLRLEPSSDLIQSQLDDAESSINPDSEAPSELVEFHAKNGFVNERTPTDKNMVQSIKTLRDHRLKPIGTSESKSTALEESAMFGNVDEVREGLFIDTVVFSDVDQLTKLIEEDVSNGMSMRDSIIKAIRKTSQVKHGGDLAKGKAKREKSGLSEDNIIDSKRNRQKVRKYVRLPTHHDDIGPSINDPALKPQSRGSSKMETRIGKGKRVAKVGDLISVSSKLFDGDQPGSYSSEHPDRVFGTVTSISSNGIAKITWIEDGSSNDCKLRDLKVEKEKFTSDSAVAAIVALLVEGDVVKFTPIDEKEWPKTFFEVLVRSDWRRWVEAVKKEMDAWNDNNAVTVVPIVEVPHSARIVPLGELYSIKRDETYKFRQYLMGNLLRAGIDYDNNFSTTISSTGTTVFFSIGTTSRKQIGGWDAVAGYLQTTEQFDIYAYLPTHAEYSGLDYDEIALLRKSFLKIYQSEGLKGIKKWANNHKKEYRRNPDKVYKCNSSIYGNQSAGMEFEKLMNSVHIQTAGMTQTQPEPSMYIKLKVDSNDKVVGYLIVIAFVDDVRFFGTAPEIDEYKKHVMSRLKVKFVDPPVDEFISIETYQDLDRGTCELKMPRYFAKAKTFFKDFIKGKDFKTRTIPLSVIDEKILLEPASPEEIIAAKNLPFLQAVGILSYPASNCKFEMRYAISVLGSRRAGWSTRQFHIAVKLFEYALSTCEIGLMFSDGLDPHGRNVLYAYGDASLRIPRPQGCRILMLNGAAVSFTSKMQTLTAPSTTWAETKTLFDCSTDVLGLRNLLYELGHLQEGPTTIYQDNKSAIQIATNRGSLGKTSRAMDLQTLSIRDRIEDHHIFPIYLKTDKMLADMGSKALAETPFVQFRDLMNGYALVKASFPDLQMPRYVYDISDDPEFNRDFHHSSSRISSLIMGMKYHTLSDDDLEDDCHYDNENITDDEEEEEDDAITSDDDGEAQGEGVEDTDENEASQAMESEQLKIASPDEILLRSQPPPSRVSDELIHQYVTYVSDAIPHFKKMTQCSPYEVRWGNRQSRKDSDNQSSEDTNNGEQFDKGNVTRTKPRIRISAQAEDIFGTGTIPCRNYHSKKEYCKWGNNCRFLHMVNDKNTNPVITRSVDKQCQTDRRWSSGFVCGSCTQVIQRGDRVATNPYSPINTLSITPTSMSRANTQPSSKYFENLHCDRATSNTTRRIRGGAPDNDDDEKDKDEQSSDTHNFTSEFVQDLSYVNVHQLRNQTPNPYVFDLQMFPQGIWENDDLPDPRLYNIDVQDLRHWHIQDNLSTTPFEEMTYNSFHHYLQAIEPAYLIVKMDEAKTKYTRTTVEQHLPTSEKVILAAPSALMFFQECYPFSLDPQLRSRQVNRALNTFIVRLEVLIDNKTLDEVTDNVFWGTITLNPSPKKAWLRWLRWKKYYLNLTVTNIRHDRVTTELVDPHYGPPFIRPKDRQRMSMHNCFTLDSETAQYTCIGGCLDVFDDDPPVSHVPYSMVVISQHVSIWHCAYRPWGFHDDYDERTFWPSNNPTVGPTLSWRTQRLNKYIRSINPEWGRKAKGRNDSNTWGGTSTDAVESSNKMEPPSKISRYQ